MGDTRKKWRAAVESNRGEISYDLYFSDRFLALCVAFFYCAVMFVLLVGAIAVFGIIVDQNEQRLIEELSASTDVLFFHDPEGMFGIPLAFSSLFAAAALIAALVAKSPIAERSAAGSLDGADHLSFIFLYLPLPLLFNNMILSGIDPKNYRERVARYWPRMTRFGAIATVILLFIVISSLWARGE